MKMPRLPLRRGVLTLLMVLLVTPAHAGGSEESVVLMEVNGQEITSERIDAMIMTSHGRMDMQQTGEELMVRLLDKAVNDALILQDAVGLCLLEEDGVLEPAEDAAIGVAVREFVRDRHEAPSNVTEREVETFFDDMYHRIQLRRISLRTRDEIDAVRTAILEGTDMDAIARQSSLDSKKPVGGLMNFIHWADLSVPFREACEDLAEGELSQPFRNNDAWTIVRVEKRAAPDRAELSEYEDFIRGVLLHEKREAAWREFVDALEAETPITVHEDALDRMRADAELVHRGEFLVPSDEPALTVDATHVLDEGGLRDATSKLAMERGTVPFEEVLTEVLRQEKDRLLLRTHAERAGYLEREEALVAYDTKLEETLINVYLNETVVSKIAFDRDEFDAFYEENKDRFRGTPQVKLSFMLLDTREQAEGAHARLADGADFDYLRREMQGAGHAGDTAKWASETMFSPNIVAAVKEMEVGESSEVLEFNSRWMIVRLDGRREGEILPIEEVDMQIRQALFQREFRERLDAQLSLIKERSEIVRHDERIRKYFAAES